MPALRHRPGLVAPLSLGVAGVLAGTLLGCGDASERRPTTADGRPLPFQHQGSEPNKGTPGAQDHTGGKVDVPIRDGRFTQARMDLRIGQIVVFTNDEDELHAVWADDRRLPHSGAIPVGGRYEYQPLEAGRVSYHCPIHPDMTGLLVVAER